MKKTSAKYFLTAIIFLAVISNLLFIRLITPKELDDVHPQISCSEKILKKSDILWIIPNFNNIPIDKNQEWCAYIKSLNKTLGMHGIQHTFNEFQKPMSQEQLEEGITIFENCFNSKPTLFKPPQLKISKSNRQLIKNNNLSTKLYINQITHKVYHCSDTGFFSNKFVDSF